MGGVTGGVLSFTSVAMMIYPALYGGLLAITDSYSVGFFVCSIPALISGIIFLRPPIDAPWIRSILRGIVWCLRRDRLTYGAVIAMLGAFIGISAVYLQLV